MRSFSCCSRCVYWTIPTISRTRFTLQSPRSSPSSSASSSCSSTTPAAIQASGRFASQPPMPLRLTRGHPRRLKTRLRIMRPCLRKTWSLLQLKTITATSRGQHLSRRTLCETRKTVSA